MTDERRPPDSDASVEPPSGPDLDRMRAAVRAQLFRAAVTLHDEDVIAERYRLEKRIGKGSTATVWQARDEREGRIVAIKLLRSRDLFAGTGVERMLREARLAGGLDHPNIVRVLDCGRYGDDKAFVVMELLEGKSLAARIADDGPLSWERAREVLLQIADALATAHRSGVVHRDLKPANVIVTEVGTELHCKVIDFGLARPTGVDPSTGKLTGTGLVFGTPRYMSPEHVRGQPLDARADVYALGCLAYEMITGLPAVTSETIAEVLLDHLYRHPRPFAEVAPRVVVPPGAESIVLRATRKAPELRFADMEALRNAVIGLDRGEPVDVPEERLEMPKIRPESQGFGRRLLVALGLASLAAIGVAQVMS